MVSTEPVLLIVAADRRELAGIARAVSGCRQLDLGLEWSQAGRLGARAVVLAAHGAGRTNAAQVVETVAARLPLGGVMSTGLCGALDPGLRPGEVVVGDRVLSLDPPAEFPASLARGSRMSSAARGGILTVDRVVQTAEEKKSLRATGAVAVEMEAAGVALEAEKRNVPFFCVRVVSDGAAESFRIDYNRARLASGRFSIQQVMVQAGLHPGRWAELLGWWRGVHLGSRVLGEFVRSLEFES